MKELPIEQYLKMRNALLKEKAGLEKRLAAINAALGVPAPLAAAPAPPAGGPAATSTRGGWKRVKNAMSLREAVLKVTAEKPLTKPEILEALDKLGYKFATPNPMNRLNVLLYGRYPKFKREQGRFSPA